MCTQCRCSNAKRGPKADFNSYMQFVRLDNAALFVAATMTLLGLKNVTGKLKRAHQTTKQQVIPVTDCRDGVTYSMISLIPFQYQFQYANEDCLAAFTNLEPVVQCHCVTIFIIHFNGYVYFPQSFDNLHYRTRPSTQAYFNITLLL